MHKLKRTERFRPNTQQFALAFNLRSIKEGWTEADRVSYFSWFPKAKTWQGGNSFSIFIENSRKEALANVTNAAQKSKYDKISSKSLIPPRAIESPKGPGQVWTIESAVAAVEKNSKEETLKAERISTTLWHAQVVTVLQVKVVVLVQTLLVQQIVTHIA